MRPPLMTYSDKLLNIHAAPRSLAIVDKNAQTLRGGGGGGGGGE